MSRQERRHQQQSKKSTSWGLWIGLLVLLAILAGLWFYNANKPTGVDYSQYGMTDDVYASPDATTVIEEFSDFQCPACQALSPTIKAIRDAYKGKVRVEYKQYPLRQIHEFAQSSAEASECAREQNRFWAYHDVLFDSKQLNKRALKLHAQGLGLDMAKWQSCIDEGRAKTTISSSMLEGNGRGVEGTPTIFVNGELFTGRTVSAFEAAIK